MSCSNYIVLLHILLYFDYIQTLSYNNYENPNYEIVHLPQKFVDTNEDLSYNFDAFGRYVYRINKLKYNNVLIFRTFNLKLSQSNIVSPTYKSFLKLANDKTILLGLPTKRCHYFHKDSNLIAAISTCDGKSIVTDVL